MGEHLRAGNEPRPTAVAMPHPPPPERITRRWPTVTRTGAIIEVGNWRFSYPLLAVVALCTCAVAGAGVALHWPAMILAGFVSVPVAAAGGLWYATRKVEGLSARQRTILTGSATAVLALLVVVPAVIVVASFVVWVAQSPREAVWALVVISVGVLVFAAGETR